MFETFRSSTNTVLWFWAICVEVLWRKSLRLSAIWRYSRAILRFVFLLFLLSFFCRANFLWSFASFSCSRLKGLMGSKNSPFDRVAKRLTPISIPTSEGVVPGGMLSYSVCMLTSHFSPRRITVTFFIVPMIFWLFRYPTQPTFGNLIFCLISSSSTPWGKRIESCRNFFLYFGKLARFSKKLVYARSRSFRDCWSTWLWHSFRKGCFVFHSGSLLAASVYLNECLLSFAYRDFSRDKVRL